VFLAGQTPMTPGGTLVEGGFDQQARQTFDNLRAVAAAAGGSLRDVVRVGVYLRDMANFARMNEIYSEYFQAPLPARTTIPAPLPGFDIEVDAILVLGGQ
jgi:reactive intermediate/imine deaminase